jgi:hypothetical protein
MHAKYVSICIVLLFVILGWSGCTDLDQGGTDTTHDDENGGSNTYSGSIINEIFSIDEQRGTYTSPNSEIYLSYDEATVFQTTNFSVSTVATFPDVDSVLFVVGYDFSPDGTQFNKPVHLQIMYNENDVPPGVDEEDLGIYLYENNDLTKVDNCVIDPDYNMVTGDIFHFCQYLVCSYTTGSGGTGTGGSGNSTGSGSNNSSVYTFEVSLQSYEQSYISPPDYDRETYSTGMFAVWDPQPYVRYYEVTVHFNGNEPEAYAWEKTWRQQGETWGNDPWVQYVDNELFILCEEKYYPGYGKYVGIFNNYESKFPGKHAMGFEGVHDLFYNEKCGGCYPDQISTSGEILEYKKQMKEFIEDYYQGWSVTVRAVT